MVFNAAPRRSPRLEPVLRHGHRYKHVRAGRRRRVLVFVRNRYQGGDWVRCQRVCVDSRRGLILNMNVMNVLPPRRLRCRAVVKLGPVLRRSRMQCRARGRRRVRSRQRVLLRPRLRVLLIRVLLLLLLLLLEHLFCGELRQPSRQRARQRGVLVVAHCQRARGPSGC